MQPGVNREGVEWQVGIWDQMSKVYLNEIERRFIPVVEGVIARAALKPGERVLDVGTGTGAVALQAAAEVGRDGAVVGIDISSDMLLLGRQRAAGLGFENVDFRPGRAEAIPAEDSTFDVVLASLSLMYVINRAAAAREMARALRPGGRFVAAVWAAPEECDIVLFQQMAGSFAPPPPVPGVGPGSLADSGPFLRQLAQAGIQARIEREGVWFDFDDFESAWEVLAGVTTAQLEPARQEKAKKAVRDAMWNEADASRRFYNMTQFILGRA